MTALTMDYSSLNAAQPAGGARPLSTMVIGLLALLAAASAVWGFFRVTGAQPVARIAVAGSLRHVHSADVEAVVRPLVDAPFSAVDLDGVRRAVEALPWVKRARVERRWPATVSVRIWEREATAHWRDGELLDRDADVYAPAGQSVAGDLPELTGPEHSGPLVLGMYRQLAGKLKASPFALSGLHLDARGDWTGVSRGGIQLRFGRGNPVAKTETLLGPARRALAGRMNEVAHIDLRYTNGFAVGWQTPSAASKGK